MPAARRNARPIEWPSLPRVPRTHTDAVADWLTTKFDIYNDPSTSSAFLALLYELEKREMFIPTRERMADHLGVSKFGIDTVLSREMGRGVIEREEWLLVPGEERRKVLSYDKSQIKGRPHIRKRRRLYLCKELKQILARLDMQRAA